MRLGALEAGGTKMVLAVGDETGRIIERISIPTRTPAETMPEMISYFKEKELENVIMHLRSVIVSTQRYTITANKNRK